MRDEILEEFNVECVSRFLESIIKKNPSFARMDLNSRKLLAASMKLVTIV
ncbi:MAG: hypothetical protein ACTS73_08645 [Arsenophonus sp. NEOnobi-MAG3]